MKKPAPKVETVLPENRTLRFALTLAFVITGMVTGGILAQSYNRLLVVQPGWLKDHLAGAPPSAAGRVWAVIAFIVVGGLIGFLLSSFAYRGIQRARRELEEMTAREKAALFLGLVVSLILTLLITVNFRMPVWVTVIVAFLLCYLAIAATMSVKEQLRFYAPVMPAEPQEPEAPRQQPKILDTNVIIDGRILDICRTGFLEGAVLIPRFILDELQHIADAEDPLRRARGRRGLDILNQMRKDLGIKVTTYDPTGYPLPAEVDSKLVAIAQHLDAAIVTNDFNLNKVAELQGVTVLNVNELVSAVKPVLLPGENLTVLVIKEGNQPHQGVAYLDDGTMVVVENGQSHIGSQLEVEVASVLQTVAGKMIFATVKSDRGPQSDPQAGGASRGAAPPRSRRR